MDVMRAKLDRTVEAEEERIVEEIFRQVRLSRSWHYRAEERPLLAERCALLVREFRRSLSEDSARLADHVCSIAVERIAEGYRLRELQLALSILEQELWRLCDRALADRDELLEALSLVSWIVGHAKDELARTYLDLKERAEARTSRNAGADATVS
jgi:hypothetical protein